MAIDEILFALSMITFILAAMMQSAYLLHGGFWLAAVSVASYAGKPLWWALPAVAVSITVHLVVQLVLDYRASVFEMAPSSEDGADMALASMGRWQRLKWAAQRGTGRLRFKPRSEPPPEGQAGSPGSAAQSLAGD